MRRTSLSWVLLILVLVVVGGLACTSDAEGATPNESAAAEHAAEEPELARYMMDLQHWSHKAALALEARNAELADFYLHEMEESIETLQAEAPTYEGHAVADLTEKMLEPSVEAFDESLDDRAWSTVDERVQDLAHSCTQCHETTGYGFVQVDLEEVPNPYAQTFDPSSNP